MKKPKHRVFCPDCQKEKMQFETRKEAEMHIKYNSENLKKPVHPYYCQMCCCWHVTSHNSPSYQKRVTNKLKHIEEQKKREDATKLQIQLENNSHSAETAKLMRSVNDKYNGLYNRWLMNENNVSINELEDFLNYIIDIRENNLYIGKESKKKLNKIRISIEDKIERKLYEREKCTKAV